MSSRFVWYDLMTQDPQAAKAFYGELVGWKTTKFDGPQLYEVWNVKDKDSGVGGVMQLPEEARSKGSASRWIGYVFTPDVDASAQRAQRLGGKLLNPAEDIPGGVGRFAQVADPQGADFFLFKPNGPESAPPPNPGPVGTFGWAELNTTDWKSAWKFYSELFGWRATHTMSMGPELGDYFMFGADAQNSFGGMSDAAKTQKQRPHWLYYVRVKNVDEAAKRVPQLGGKVLYEPMEVPGGDRVAAIQDPQGAMIGLASSSK
jgi:uncharacterized protein